MTRLDDDIPYQDILQYISDNKLKGTTSNRTLWEAVHANYSTNNRTLWEAVHANHSIIILMSGAPSLHFHILLLLYTERSFKNQVFTLYVICRHTVRFVRAKTWFFGMILCTLKTNKIPHARPPQKKLSPVFAIEYV